MKIEIKNDLKSIAIKNLNRKNLWDKYKQSIINKIEKATGKKVLKLSI